MDVISKENTEHYTWGGVCEGWFLLRTRGLNVVQEQMPPGAAEEMHCHERAMQFFFVLGGEAILEIREQKFTLGTQQGISVPPRTPHRLLNASSRALSFIVVSAPPCP